nr:MAG TPA: hypothetical protein [Caudoviricetes sp.]
MWGGSQTKGNSTLYRVLHQTLYNIKIMYVFKK